MPSLVVKVPSFCPTMTGGVVGRGVAGCWAETDSCATVRTRNSVARMPQSLTQDLRSRSGSLAGRLHFLRRMPKPVLRRGKTIWLQNHRRPQRHPVLRGHHDTDIAIVGGGMTGAMIAEAFASAGARVAVVEAARVGHGSTAASTALLLQEPDYDLDALTKRY